MGFFLRDEERIPKLGTCLELLTIKVLSTNYNPLFCNNHKINDLFRATSCIFKINSGNLFPGTVPLRKLVYRVLPLPPSMHEYVYDFGTVRGKTEEDYIEKIVTNEV